MMNKHEWRKKKKAWDAINHLRHRYRIGNGDEAELVAEITALSAQWGYPTETNNLLFHGDAHAVFWGFACWKIETDTGKSTRQLLNERKV